MYADIKSRLQKSKSLLEEALKHGSVESRTVVCLLVGVAGAGKTHTKHLLFRWDPPKSRNSTPLAVRPVQAIRVLAREEGGELQEVDPDQLDAILASRVATGVSLENSAFIRRLCCNRCNRKTESTGIALTSRKLHLPPSNSTSYKERVCCCCNGSNSELLEIVKSILDETARQIATTSEKEELLNDDWIYLIDSGGQIEFLEVLPAFLQHTSVCLFVTNLSEKLIDHPKIEYFENGMRIGEPTLCPFSNEEMLLRCVQTIQTQCTLQNGSRNKGSKLVMVGTHRDLENLCKESREEKNQKLRSKLCPEFDQSLVFYGQNMEEIVFAINANTPDPHDREVAGRIAEVIFNVASNLEPRRTPISWFKFEQLIQKLNKEHGKTILHWKECLQVAKLLHLSKADLNAALNHLASFGVIHYWDVLPNIVFLDPQLLLDKISELIKHHYKLSHTVDTKEATGGEWREFRNEGCITVELLKMFPKHYTDIFTPDDFLKVMTNRQIVTHYINNDKYLMPCLLRTMEYTEVEKHRVLSSSEHSAAPLAIHFSCRLVPHGVFCSLIAFLRSQTSCWKFSLNPEETSKPLCLTRNCIIFQLPKGAPGSLTLIDMFSHFEVYINAPHDTCVSSCPSIWHALRESINKVAQTLGYVNLAPKLAFICKCKSNQPPHLALPDDVFNYWKCMNSGEYGRLTQEHFLWCPEKGNYTNVHVTTMQFLYRDAFRCSNRNYILILYLHNILHTSSTSIPCVPLVNQLHAAHIIRWLLLCCLHVGPKEEV